MEEAPESSLEFEVDGDAELSPRRRRRWRMFLRIGVFAILLMALLVATGGWLVTRSWFIVSQLTPEMERKLGGKVTIGRAAYQGDGRVIFTNLRLHVPGKTGPAAEVVSINRALVRVDLAKLLTGGVAVLDVEVDDATFRLSEDQNNSGKLNVMELHPDWSSQKKGPTAPPPRVRIRRAALEFGAHHEADYQMLGRRVVSGEMYASSGQEGWYNFELAEVDENGRGIGPGGIFIKGSWNPEGNEHHCRIDGIELDDRVYRMCPQAARLWWDRMELHGKVDSVVLNYHSDRPFSVEFAVSNVGLTLPVDTGNLWARYHEGEIQPTASRPRMRVNSGTIRVSNDSVVLEKMKGQLASTDDTVELASVPFNISFAMTSLPPLDWDSREQWMEQVIRTAPFDLQFRMDQFGLTRNEAGVAPALDLPVLVAKVLAKFQMTDWVMSTSVDVSRGMPTTDENGKLVAATPITNGQAYIHKASGKYQKFPYQLNEVDAYMQFDNDKVLVHYLNGKGAGDSQFRITGMIAPPENDASVLLRVSGTNVPLDDRLREALREGEQQAFDSLFNREVFDALQQASLLPSEESIERAKLRQRDVAEQIASARQDETVDEGLRQDKLARLQQEHSRLQRMIDAGPFQLGGSVNIDLKIERALGPKQATTTTGTLQIVSAGAVYEKFPYPLRVTGGTLELQNDRIAIQSNETNAGLTFVTPGGGRGLITGDLGFPKADGKRKVQPNFVITVGDDEINNIFLAAIPMSKAQRAKLPADQHWPGTLSKAGQIVQGIGFGGTCDYAGVVNTNDQGKIGFDFDISMGDGSAQPTRELATQLGFVDEPWDSNLMLQGVHGSVNVTRDGVKWTDVTGHDGESNVVANGAVDYSGEDTSTTVAVHLDRLPVEARVLNVAPPEYAMNLAQLWTRFQPQGVFDSDITYTSNAQGDTTVMTIEPRDMSVMLYGKRIGLAHEGGTFRIGNQSIELDQFAMRMTSAEQRDDGVLTLSGGRGRGASGWRVNGTWDNARFESPMVLEVLNTGDRELAKRYRELRAAGGFDAKFTVSEASAESPIDYRIDIKPHQVEARWNGTPLQADILNGTVTVVPGQMQLDQLAGTMSGDDFKLNGVILTDNLIDATLNVAYNGALRTNHVRAFLPRVAVDAFTGINFDDANTKSNVNVDLRIAQMPGYVGQWKTKADGTIQTHGASFEAGVLFTDVHGDFALKADYAPGATPKFSIDSNVGRAVALGQKLTNLRAPMTLDQTATSMVMPWLVSEAELGTVTASASVGVGDHRDYEVAIEMVSVPLDEFANAQSAASAPPTPPAPSAAPAPQSAADAKATPTGPSPTGDVYASLSVAGRRGEPESKRGRGTLRILNGNLANVPLVLQLMQMLQLTMPGSGVLDYADAEMYLMGDRVVFERILFESTSGKLATLQLFGEGEMNFQTFELNTRFRSRSGVRGLREVIGVISDTLYEIEVTGTLRSPQPRMVPLPTKK